MLENRTQQIPARIATLARAAIQRPLLVLAALLCLSIAVTAMAGKLDYRTWKALSSGEDYDIVCYEDEFNDGVTICEDSCPLDSNGICAEFSDDQGHVSLTCCIPEYRVGSSDPEECLFNVELIRTDPEPVE